MSSAAGLAIPIAATLQQAYDNNQAANPHILVDNANPLRLRADATGPVLQVQDTVGANIFEVDDTFVEVDGNLRIVDAFTNHGAANSLTITDTFTAPAFVGGGILSNGTVTYANTTFIWALLQESKLYIADVGPGFAAFTLFNALAQIRNGLNAALVQALCLNVGIAHQATGAVAVTSIGTTGVSFSPNTRALTAGGSMTKTGDTALRVSPTHGTVFLSAIDHGIIRGVHCFNPAVALFQPSAGTEAMSAYIGLDVDAIPFGGNVTKRAVRSFLAAATNTRFLDGQGTAQSDLRGTLNFPVDLVGIQYGAGTDWFEAWAGGGFKIEQDNNLSEQFRKSFPAAGRMLFDWSNAMEWNVNCENGFSLGFQSGANGNQFGNFVTNARTIGVSGEWADFLLTQGGNLLVNGNNMSRVSAWVINGVSYASSSGTVSNAETLTVGGFPTSAPGVTITERQSLHVIGGRSRFKSTMQYDTLTPTALGAGVTDDYAGLLTGTANNGMRHLVRLQGDAGGTSALGGIDATAAQGGDVFKLVNVSANNITLQHQAGTSVAANRIISPTGANYVLGPDESCEIYYDTTDARWRILYGTGA